MLLPIASDLEEEPTIDWNKVLDNMQGTPLNVSLPKRTSYSVGNGLLPSSVYAQSNVLYVSMYYRALLLYFYVYN